MGIFRDYVWVLSFYAAILACTYVLHKKLKDKPDSVKRFSFLAVTVTILLLEAARQIVALTNGYTADNLPLYLCSLLMPVFALASFSKSGSRLYKIGHSLSLIIGLPIAISIILIPSVVFQLQVYGSATQNIFTQNAVFRHYHSFFFHMLALFFVTLCVAFKPYTPKKSDIILAVGAFLPFVLVSTAASALVDIDYIQIWSLSLAMSIPVPLLVILYQIIPMVGTALCLLLIRAGAGSKSISPQLVGVKQHQNKP